MAGMSADQWSRVIDVSLNGFFNVTQPLLLLMIGTRWGRIVSISSVAATMGNRGQTNYAAAKAGLEGASRSLAREVASRGITVNVVSPRHHRKRDERRLRRRRHRRPGPDETRRIAEGRGGAGDVPGVGSRAAYISGQTIGGEWRDGLSYQRCHPEEGLARRRIFCPLATGLKNLRQTRQDPSSLRSSG